MADTIEEYVREIRQQFLHSLTPEERQAVLDQLPPEEIFKHFTPEECLHGLKPEERLRGLGPEERLRGLGAEELRQLQDYLKTVH